VERALAEPVVWVAPVPAASAEPASECLPADRSRESGQDGQDRLGEVAVDGLADR
jgi:hypothetical protein